MVPAGRCVAPRTQRFCDPRQVLRPHCLSVCKARTSGPIKMEDPPPPPREGDRAPGTSMEPHDLLASFPPKPLSLAPLPGRLCLAKGAFPRQAGSPGSPPRPWLAGCSPPSSRVLPGGTEAGAASAGGRVAAGSGRKCEDRRAEERKDQKGRNKEEEDVSSISLQCFKIIVDVQYHMSSGYPA